MAHFAKLTGDLDGMARYAELAEKIRLKTVDLFWDQPDIEVPNQQTLLATLLASEVLNPDDQILAMDRLLEVLEKADYHVSTGIFGTKYLLETLSSHGHTDIAFRVVNQSGFPGWKYMVDSGATTVWETWKESDNTYSQNHPMFGSVSEWYHKWLGGIQPDPENPGHNSVILKPRPVPGLDSLSVEKRYPSGSLISRWRWKGKTLCFEFSIPENLSVKWIPQPGNAELLVKKSPDGWDPVKNKGTEGYALNKPGRYIFEL